MSEDRVQIDLLEHKCAHGYRAARGPKGEALHLVPDPRPGWLGELADCVLS